MPLKLHIIDDEGKYIETQILESDKEASAKAHKSIYHFPETPFTRVKPPKERDGLNRYYIDGKWEYREILPEPEEEPKVEEDAQTEM